MSMNCKEELLISIFFILYRAYFTEHVPLLFFSYVFLRRRFCISDFGVQSYLVEFNGSTFGKTSYGSPGGLEPPVL